MSSAQATRAGRAFVELFTDDTKLVRGLRRAEGRIKAFGAKVTGIGARMIAAGAAILTPLAGMVKIAGDAGESLNRFRQVFGEYTAAATSFVDNLAGSIGRSKTEIKDSMATFMSLFKGLGYGAQEAFAMSKQIQRLALDFASFNNLTDEEAYSRFIAGLSGSSEVFDRFGINIKQAALQQELFRQGVNKAWSEVSEQEKVAARLSIIMASMGKQGAIGDAERTSGEFAATTKRVKGNLQELAETIGKALLPGANELLKKFSDLVQNATRFAGENEAMVVSLAKTAARAVVAGAAFVVLGKSLHLIGGTIGGVSAIVKTIGTLLTVAQKVAPVIAATAKAMGELSVAMVMNPASLGIVAAAGAFAALAVAIYKAKNAREAYTAASDVTDKLDASAAAYEGKTSRGEVGDYLKQLVELEKKQKLTNEEMAKADTLIRNIQNRYAGFNVEIDSATGKLVGMKDATVELLRQFRADHFKELSASIKETAANIQKLETELESIDPEDSGSAARMNSLIARIETRREWLKHQKDELESVASGSLGKFYDTRWRRVDIDGLDNNAMTQKAIEGIADPQWLRRLNILKLQGIEDTFEREKALINERYDYEVDQAAGAAATIKAINAARQIELANVDKKQEADKQRKSASLADSERQQDYRIEELKIRNKFTGFEVERKLIELRYRYDVQVARMMGTNIEKLAEIRDLQISAVNAAEEGSKRVRSQLAQVSGAYAGGVVGRMGGSSIQERIAKASEATAKNTAATARNTEEGATFSGR